MDWVESALSELRKHVPVNDLVRLVLSYTHCSTLVPIKAPRYDLWMTSLWNKAVHGATTVFERARVHRIVINHKDHCRDHIGCGRGRYMAICDFFVLASWAGRGVVLIEPHTLDQLAIADISQ